MTTASINGDGVQPMSVKTSGSFDPDEHPRRRAIMVVGMHQPDEAGGMDTAAALLRLAGCTMSAATGGETAAEATGTTIEALERRILDGLGRAPSGWSPILPIPFGAWCRDDLQPLFSALFDQVRTVVDGTAGPLMFATPLGARLLPLWIDILGRLDLDPVFVHIVACPRPAAAVIGSDAWDLTELQWLTCHYEIVTGLAEYPTLMIDHEDWRTAPTISISRLYAHVGIVTPPPLADALAVIAAFSRTQGTGAPVTAGVVGDFYAALLADRTEATSSRAVDASQALGPIFQLTAPLAGKMADRSVAHEYQQRTNLARIHALERRLADLRDRHDLLAMKMIEQEAAATTVHLARERDQGVVRLDDLSSDGTMVITGHAAIADTGVVGAARMDAMPDCPIIVDALVDGERVASVLTRSSDAIPLADHAFTPIAGSFRIPWSAFRETHSGQAITLRAAGARKVFARPGNVPPLDASRRLPEDGQVQAYRAWLTAHKALSLEDRENATVQFGDLDVSWPLVSVLLLGNGSAEAIIRSLRSLQAQTYDNWEALIVYPPETALSREPRLRYSNAADLAGMVSDIHGGFTCFLQIGDVLAPDALLALTHAAINDVAADLVYADEDRFDPIDGGRSDPEFKGAWSIDVLLHRDYAIRPALVKSPQLRHYASGDTTMAAAYGTILRLALDGMPTVLHIPEIFYHRAATGPFDDTPSADARHAALAACRPEIPTTPDAENRPTIVWPLPASLPKVSLIVPTRDRIDLLGPCIDGILHRTDYSDFEILIVDNDSSEPQTIAYLERIAQDPRVRVLPWAGAFDYSAINNFAAGHAAGKIIGLINNDLKVIGPDWLTAMVRHAVRPDIGAVGARLLYADGTLQHAGVVMGIGTASHRYKGFPADHPGHAGILHIPHDLTAVTAACMLVRRDVWQQVDGLSLDFPIAYNDIDLCLKIRRAGYRILYEPAATLFHLESQSRGLDLSPANKARLTEDRDRLNMKWGMATIEDVFYNPNLTIKSVNAGLAFPPRTAKSWRTTPRKAALPT